MRRSSRYPTRSTVNRTQNSGVADGSGSSSAQSVPERRTSDRSRSQTDRLGTVPPPQPSHSYSRVQPPHGLSQSQQQQSTHTAHYAMYRNQQTGQLMGTVCPPVQHSQPNITISTHTSQIFRGNQPTYNSYSMPRTNDMIMMSRPNEVKFIKLNSYDDMKILIRPRNICKSME